MVINDIERGRSGCVFGDHREVHVTLQIGEGAPNGDTTGALARIPTTARGVGRGIDKAGLRSLVADENECGINERTKKGWPILQIIVAVAILGGGERVALSLLKARLVEGMDTIDTASLRPVNIPFAEPAYHDFIHRAEMASFVFGPVVPHDVKAVAIRPLISVSS